MPRQEHNVPLTETDTATGAPMLRFGNWLVRRGLIDQAQRDHALRAAAVCNCRVGDALVYMAVLDRGCVEEEATDHDTFTAFHRFSHLTELLLGQPRHGPVGRAERP